MDRTRVHETRTVHSETTHAHVTHHSKCTAHTTQHRTVVQHSTHAFTAEFTTSQQSTHSTHHIARAEHHRTGHAAQPSPAQHITTHITAVHRSAHHTPHSTTQHITLHITSQNTTAQHKTHAQGTAHSTLGRTQHTWPDAARTRHPNWTQCACPALPSDALQRAASRT